jgi:hypothetical protein
MAAFVAAFVFDVAGKRTEERRSCPLSSCFSRRTITKTTIPMATKPAITTAMRIPRLPFEPAGCSLRPRSSLFMDGVIALSARQSNAVSGSGSASASGCP